MLAMTRDRTVAVVIGVLVVGGALAYVGAVIFLNEQFGGNPEIVDLEDLASTPASFEVLGDVYRGCGSNGGNGRQGYLNHDIAISVDGGRDPLQVLTEWLVDQGFVAQSEDGPMGPGRPFRLNDVDDDGNTLPPGDIGAFLWVPGDSPDLHRPARDMKELATEHGGIVLRLRPITPCAF